MITCRISGTRTADLLDDHRRRIVRTIPELMRRSARAIAIQLAVATQPFGVGANARQAGENAVKRDVARVYVSVSKVYKSFPNQKHANAYWAAITKRNYAQAQNIKDSYNPIYRRIPIRAFDGGAAHQAARKNRGRVVASQKPLMVVQRDRSLDTYTRKQVGHVGEAKGGWAACAKILGSTRGLPQWVTRHAGTLSPGSVLESYAGPVYRVRLINGVRYASSTITQSDKQAAMVYGLHRFIKGQITAAALHGRMPHE